MGKSNRQGEQHKIPAGAVRQRGRTPESAQPFLWYSCVPLDGCPWERGDLKLQGLKSWGEFWLSAGWKRGEVGANGTWGAGTYRSNTRKKKVLDS